MVGIAHAQTQTGYRIPPRADIGGGRMTGDIWCQYGTNGVRFKIGTQAVTQVGTVGVINGTNAIGLPSLDFTYAGGSTSANFNGFNAVYIAGSKVGTSGALTGELDAVGGIGTNNTFNNPTLAGVGTITASFGANNLVISPAEYSMLDGAIIPLNTATGSITNHAHTGNDGTTQVSHTNLTDRGTQTHTQIDTFIASKASASGVASLDANSLVVQNPASGTSTPGISKISISLGTGLLDDSWLSSVISKLGQTIELGTETTGNTNNITEGSTNQYYTNARVNLVIGSSSITSPQVSPKITFTSPAAGQFLKIVDAQGNVENGTSSATVDFSAVTGSATSAQLPSNPVISGNLYVSGVVGGTTTGALVIPSGTTVQRPEMPTIGMMRYNTSPGTITGGIITVSGTYTIHTFNSSGTFTVGNPGLEYYTGSAWIPINRGTITTEVLVVGGGGGGAISTSGTGNGGGGAGGLISSSSYQVSGAVTVIVGAGGASMTNGNNSTFSGLVAVGGGKGGNGNNSPGNGGSGGGGDGGNTIVGTGTAAQGYNGGAGAGVSPWESGGGGGSGAVGGTGSGTVCGSGGVGTAYTISGTSTFYSGGGGGGVSYLATTAGSGGNGGGGAGGAASTPGTNGTANRGGGGGGAGHASAIGGTGGSGIIIIRYITQ